MFGGPCGPTERPAKARPWNPKPSLRVGLKCAQGARVVKEKRQWIEKKLRLEPQEAKLIEDAAHSARLPLAVYIRKLLVSGQAPKPAPPASNEVSYGSMVLSSTVNGLTSNLSQIEQHAISAGEPLSRLAGPDSAIQQLRKIALQIGLRNKSGEIGEAEIKRLMKQLHPAAQSLNDVLAKPLNQGVVVPNSDWRDVLECLQSALTVGVSDARNS